MVNPWAPSSLDINFEDSFFRYAINFVCLNFGKGIIQMLQ